MSFLNKDVSLTEMNDHLIVTSEGLSISKVEQILLSNQNWFRSLERAYICVISSGFSEFTEVPTLKNAVVKFEESESGKKFLKFYGHVNRSSSHLIFTTSLTAQEGRFLLGKIRFVDLDNSDYYIFSVVKENKIDECKSSFQLQDAVYIMIPESQCNIRTK